MWLRDTTSWLLSPVPHKLGMAATPAVEAGGPGWRASRTFTVLCDLHFGLAPEHFHLLRRSVNSNLSCSMVATPKLFCLVVEPFHLMALICEKDGRLMEDGS